MYNAESIEKWNRNGEVSNTIPDGGVAVLLPLLLLD